MKTIKYSNARRDNTLYRYRYGAYDYDAVTVSVSGDIVLSTIRPSSDMSVLIDIPDGTHICLRDAAFLQHLRDIVG